MSPLQPKTGNTQVQNVRISKLNMQERHIYYWGFYFLY